MKSIYIILLTLISFTPIVIESQIFSLSTIVTTADLKQKNSSASAFDEIKSKKTKQEASNSTNKNNAPVKFITQLGLLLIIIYFGIKKGGVSLGLLGGLGVAILVLLFRDSPGLPPIDVMLIILAVVTASSTLEATGALGMLVSFAERILRKNPKYIVYLAPLSTFLLTMLVGTGHAVYPLLPVIYDVAFKQKIRPERPMAVASIASQMGITASPIAAATAAMIGVAYKAGITINLIDILLVTAPSCFLGVMLAST
jgi:anaerobic C4-dicarboxylate transporter DcuB